MNSQEQLVIIVPLKPSWVELGLAHIRTLRLVYCHVLKSLNTPLSQMVIFLFILLNTAVFGISFHSLTVVD